MYVGVILKTYTLNSSQGRIPHVCGGDPHEQRITKIENEYSPCMWG